MNSMTMIPVNEPLLGERELEYVTECIRTGWISSAGRFIEAFEQGWAAYCGMRHGIAVSNGTVALELAVSCLDLQPGDEIIMPTFTIISCAMAAVFNDIKPVLVDADADTWNMDVSQIEAKITPRTRAIMPVHIYGHPVDMDVVIDIAARHDLAIIEDAAEVHGAEYLSGRDGDHPVWRRCGSMGTISSFSFYANKLITTGEGGMILTNDDTIAANARDRRNLCFVPGRRFYHEALGYNFRLTNLQAALGVAQLERMDETIARKRRMGAAYTEQLQGIAGLQIPTEQEWARHVYWMYGVVLSEERGMNAVEFAQQLAERGVQTRPFFLGMHAQPALHRLGLFEGEQYPVADRLAERGLYLPSGVAITQEQIDKVCAAVKDILR